MNNLQPASTQTLINSRPWKWTYLVFYPTAVIRIWKDSHSLVIKLLYTLLGLPVFLGVFLFLAITGFALFLRPLDLSVGNRPDRTVYNSGGNYRSTFLKTGAETN
jgi:hypothetical protein